MTVLKPRGMVSRALVQIGAEGGPELDLLALAEEAQVPVEWLEQLERGQLSPLQLENLERICRILGRSPNDLLGYESDE